MLTPSRQLNPDEFPPLLREIADPPEKLYLVGSLPSFEFRYLSIVGSRKYTPYGKDACETLIGGLSGYPIVIVSGLALGIDAIAHRSALLARLPTVAVPGSGLSEEVLYPAANRHLAQEIVERGGALLSPFPNEFQATPYSFPERNRIMAGLSHATLIIEANEKSGTLITARLALEYNREVLVVPGPIFSATSWGPHELLRHGATPVRSARDILDTLQLKTASTPITTSALSRTESKVVTLLESPRTKDELVTELALPSSEVLSLLIDMEMRGIIEEKGGFVRRR